MGAEDAYDLTDGNGSSYKKITCRYIAPKIALKTSSKKNYYSPEEHVFFTKNYDKEYIMELDGMHLKKISSRCPAKKFYKYYVTKNVANESIMSRVKHHCFTLSMYVNQKTIEFKTYDTDNLYILLERSAND